MDRQVFAYSGVLDPRPGEPGNLPLVEHALDLGRTRWLWDGAVRLCYLPTAVGDDPRAIDVYEQVFGDREDVEFSVLRLFPGPSVPDVRKHLLRQDVVLVEDGSLVNLLAVWRAHGMHEVLTECWEEGIVLTGSGAGGQIWHSGGPTGSLSDQLEPLADGLGLLPFSNGVHHDSPRRLRATYRRMVARGELAHGYATEDGVGLHFVGTELEEAVTVRAGAQAWHLRPNGRGGCTETPIEAGLLVESSSRQVPPR
jgi:peptidase E